MLTPPPPMPFVNLLGVVTLFSMRFRYFLDSWHHAIVAPVITTLLFLAVFDFTLGAARADVDGVPYLQFVAPGLIAMTVMLTAFEISAWSTIDARVRGTMDSVVAAPLRPIEFIAAPILASTAGSLLNAVLLIVAMQVVIPLQPEAPLTMLVFALAGAIMMAAAGMAIGIHAEKFDHVASVLSFVVTPAIFLSGAFFPVSAYGEPAAAIARGSPFLWMIDGFRQGLIGAGEMRPCVSAMLAWGAALLAVAGLWAMVKRGYKLKR